jgi:hypothetical protein
MEFLKKNWIWILVAVVVIVAVIMYFKKKPTGTLGRAFIPGTTGNTEAITDIKTIIKQGVKSFDDLKQKALAKGYHVISKEQAAVSKMTPDPKRVVVNVVQPPCLGGQPGTADPCYPIFNVVSVG